MWSRIHLVPLLLAEGDRDAYRRQEAAKAREGEIMKDVKNWEVSVFRLTLEDDELKGLTLRCDDVMGMGIRLGRVCTTSLSTSRRNTWSCCDWEGGRREV